MSEECDHNAIHCECGHQQDIEEAVIAERKRIIAKARTKATVLDKQHRLSRVDVAYMDALVIFANELEAECE